MQPYYCLCRGDFCWPLELRSIKCAMYSKQKKYGSVAFIFLSNIRLESSMDSSTPIQTFPQLLELCQKSNLLTKFPQNQEGVKKNLICIKHFHEFFLLFLILFWQFKDKPPHVWCWPQHLAYTLLFLLTLFIFGNWFKDFLPTLVFGV